MAGGNGLMSILYYDSTGYDIKIRRDYGLLNATAIILARQA